MVSALVNSSVLAAIDREREDELEVSSVLEVSDIDMGGDETVVDSL